MIAYLDTQVVVWLCQKQLERLTPAASETIEASDLLISPIVVLELEYLYEIRGIVRPPLALQKQLESQIGLELCQHSFPDIVQTALLENWTRDPFDRLIVAHARSNGHAPLVTSDEKIRENYTDAVW